jgi:Yip1 domain
MKNPFAVFFPSSEDFQRIGLAQAWKTPFFIVVAGTSLLAWLKSCLRSWSAAADIGMLVASVVSMSISLFVIWSLLALMLYLFLVFSNSLKRITYGKIFSLVSFCGMIFLIGELVNFILLRIPLLKIRSSVFPNRFPVGLDLFLAGGHPSLPLAIFMHSINPVIIWYCATLSLGLHTIAGVSKMNARIIVASIWAIGVGSVALITSALGGTTIGIKIG